MLRPRGDLDSGPFLSRPETTLLVVEVDGGLWGGPMVTSWPTRMESARCSCTHDVAEQHWGRGYAQLSSAPSCARQTTGAVPRSGSSPSTTMRLQ